MYTKKVLALVLAVVLVFALVVPVAGAADYTKPAELEKGLPYDDATAFGGAASTTGGLWSKRTAGAYDPELDKLSIPDAAYVYTLGTEKAPASIAGYTKIDKPADLKAGQYAVYSYTSAYGDLTYVILIPAAGAPAATEPAPTTKPAPTTEPAPVEPMPMPEVDPVEHIAIPTNNALSLNGQAVPVVAAYKIDGENYFKLRDIANIVTTFNIGYDNATKVVTITPKETYVPDGSESKTAPTANNKAIISNNAVVFDGKEVADLTVYKIDGSNYFRLRDFDEKLKLFTVGYDDATKTATITAEGAPEIVVPETPAVEEPTAPATPAAAAAIDVLKALKVGDTLPATLTIDGKEVKPAWYNQGAEYTGTTLVDGLTAYFAGDLASKIGLPEGKTTDYVTWTPGGWMDATTAFTGFLPEGFASAIIFKA